MRTGFRAGLPCRTRYAGQIQSSMPIKDIEETLREHAFDETAESLTPPPPQRWQRLPSCRGQCHLPDTLNKMIYKDGSRGLRRDKERGLLPRGSHSCFGDFPPDLLPDRTPRRITTLHDVCDLCLHEVTAQSAGLSDDARVLRGSGTEVQGISLVHAQS
eukprot:s6877_g1.t1